MTWGEVVEVYRSGLPSLEIVLCRLGEFERARGDVYQIRYNHMFNRVVDNSKVQRLTGMGTTDFTGMREGLSQALQQCLTHNIT